MTARHAVYIGLDYLGEVVEQASGKWLAVDAEGRKVGRFPNRVAAAGALKNTMDAEAASAASPISPRNPPEAA